MSISLAGDILHNLTALQTADQLTINQANLSRTIQQLSTGLRINTPGDDVAGNALAEQLNAGLAIQNQGTLNAQDAVSVAQVAQGGLQQIQNLLNTLSTYATEATNATLNDTERLDLQNEVNAILKQIDETVTNTTFNGQVLLNGSIAGISSAINATVSIAGQAIIGAAGNCLVSGVSVAPVALTKILHDETFEVALTPSSAGCAFQVNVVVKSNLQGAVLTLANQPMGAAVKKSFTTTDGQTVNITLNFANLTSKDVPNIIGQQSFVETQAFQAGVSKDNALQMQVGSTLGQVVEVSAPQVTTGILFSNQALTLLRTKNAPASLNAQAALNQINHALQIVTNAESLVAAQQQTLNAQIQNNQVQSENTTAALSRITDVNVAQATTTLATQQILVQSTTSMLAQANLVPQSILKLFP